MPSQSREITDRRATGVEELMCRPVRNMKNRSRKEIVALIIEDHEAFAAFNIDRFLAV
jgi:hypothetical protein